MYDLSYHAVQLTVKSNDPAVQDVRFDTGFIIKFTSGSGFRYALVSNRHVVFPFDSVIIRTVHRSFTLPAPRYRSHCHMEPDVDLAVIYLDNLSADYPDLWTELVRISVPEDRIIPAGSASFLRAGDEILSASMPNHFYVGSSCAPIVRKGAIAVSPSLTPGEIMADISCFPSYSGSPVFMPYAPDHYHPLLLAIEKQGPTLKGEHYLQMAVCQCAYLLLDFKLYPGFNG